MSSCRFLSVDCCNDCGQIYMCGVASARITKAGSKLKFLRDHEEGKTDNDVEILWMVNSVIEYFPRGLNEDFPKLTSLSFTNCGLKEISRIDLFGFENIMTLDLRGNKLKMLPDDLFVNKSNLHYVYLSENKLESLSSKLLEPLNKEIFRLLDLQKNKKIDVIYFYDPATVDSFKKTIDANCTPPRKCANSLATICENFIPNALHPSNLIDVFKLGHRNAFLDLKEAAFERIEEMFPGKKLDKHLMNDPESLKSLIQFGFLKNL